MTKERLDGDISPGLKWGPFVTRIPIYHTRIYWPELSQGLVITLSTSMALTPLLMSAFGLNFAEAITMALLHYLLVSSSPIIFGEPYAAGWITPALPLTLSFVLGSYDQPAERFQLMTALSIDLAVILFFLGVTGLGKRFIAWIPATMRSAIIMGAALAALKRVFIDDIDKYMMAPVSTTSAIIICLLLSFSLPLLRLQKRSSFLTRISSFGLLPGFAVAAVVGPIMGEISYDIQFGFLNPPFISLWEKASPLYIGLPSIEMFIAGIPLALITYIIVFGDVITGVALIQAASPSRPDEKIDLNTTRTHLSLAIRNAIMSIFAPFFPTQGCIWTGVQVVIINRWKQGKATLDSLHSGIASYYVCGLPILIFVYPWITFLKPLLGIALALTLVLTGFACAGVALAGIRRPTEYGAVILSAICLATFSPWVGLLIAAASTFLLVGWNSQETAPDS